MSPRSRKRRSLKGRRTPRSTTSRRGIATIWVLAGLPVVLVLLVMIVDGGNLWIARMELRSALDAAALSAAKTWGEGGSTLQARLDAQDAFNTNTILGGQYSLSTTQGGGCANGNPAPAATADILLGTISDSGTGFTFDCQATPACVSGTFTLTIAVDTSQVCPGEPAAGDTFTRDSAFQIGSFTTSNPALVLNNITFTLPGAGTRFFDLRVPPPSNDGQSGWNVGDAFPPPTIYYRTAPVAVTNAASQFDSSCDSLVATDGVSSAVYSIAGTTSPSFQWTFTGFQAGDEFAFGVDTDYADGNTGAGGEADLGGEFGGSTVTVNVSGTSVMGTLVTINAQRSEVTINGVVTGGDSFGVRTRKSLSVPSISSSFLGLPVNPYQVTAISYARYACSNGPPQSVHVNTFSCACP